MEKLLQYLTDLEEENRNNSNSSIDYLAGRADLAKDIKNYIENIRKCNLTPLTKDEKMTIAEYIIKMAIPYEIGPTINWTQYNEVINSFCNYIKENAFPKVTIGVTYDTGRSYSTKKDGLTILDFGYFVDLILPFEINGKEDSVAYCIAFSKNKDMAIDFANDIKKDNSIIKIVEG